MTFAKNYLLIKALLSLYQLSTIQNMITLNKICTPILKQKVLLLSTKHLYKILNAKRNREYKHTKMTKPKVNYSFLVVLVLLALLYLYNAKKTTTTGNPKADQQLEDQQPESRPHTGELDFTN